MSGHTDRPHAACAGVGWAAIRSCRRHRRVDAAPSPLPPWQTNWGGCAPWAVGGRPGAKSTTCATCTCADAVIATQHPPGRVARPPSEHGCCRNPLGRAQRRNPFRVSGRCASATLGSSGASDPQMWSPCPGKTPATYIPTACGSGQLDRACPTRPALASWVRLSFLELASLRRDAPPVRPSALAQTLLAVAECKAHDARRDISAADRASAAAFSAMPDAPCPYRPHCCFAWSPMATSQRQRKQHFSSPRRVASAAAAAQSLARTPTARHAYHPPRPNPLGVSMRKQCADIAAEAIAETKMRTSEERRAFQGLPSSHRCWACTR